MEGYPDAPYGMPDDPETPASASPIATQETARAEIIARLSAWIEETDIPDDVLELLSILVEGGSDTIEDLRSALSASEKRNEELVRERDGWMWCRSCRTVTRNGSCDCLLPGSDPELQDLVPYGAELDLVTSLKAKVEELTRHRDMLRHLLDEANAQHFDATMRAETAEASLASLAGQVGDMREALVKIEQFGMLPGEIARAVLYQTANSLDTLRALELPSPAVSTTGEEELMAALTKACDALVLMRKASIAGCDEGYGKPEQWAGDLFAAHGPGHDALKQAGAVLGVVFETTTQFRRAAPLPPVPRDPVEEGR